MQGLSHINMYIRMTSSHVHTLASVTASIASLAATITQEPSSTTSSNLYIAMLLRSRGCGVFLFAFSDTACLVGSALRES